jgi:hypothetical protein
VWPPYTISKELTMKKTSTCPEWVLLTETLIYQGYKVVGLSLRGKLLHVKIKKWSHGK